MIEVVGHGGAGDFFPGNSRQSVEKGLELGVDRIEIDVQVAGDGSLVLLHDEHAHLYGKRYAVRQLTREQLSEAFDGLLTLEDAIAMISGKSRLMIDLKAPGYERAVAAAIVRSGIADSTIVSSTFAPSLRTIRNLAPGVEIGLSTGHITMFRTHKHLMRLTSRALEVASPLPAIAAAKAIDAQHLMLTYRIVGESFVRLAHKFGLKVYPWTVNQVRPIQRMIAIGVDGIISNRPDLVQSELAKSQVKTGS